MSSAAPLGPLLRSLRLAADLTLEGLAERSGVSDRTISDIERGASLGPQRRTVELLADALDLDEMARQPLFAAARAGRHRQPVSGVVGAAPLPRAVADFTGRDGEVAVVTEHLTSGRTGRASPVAVISGPPGFGKTTLAVRVATEGGTHFEGVHFVDLRGFDTRPLDPHSVLARLIQAVTEDAGPVPRQLDAAAAQWQSVVAGRRVLVVLDNAGTEETVRLAVPATGPAAVVITSRSTLAGLQGVVRISLDQLAPTDAVELLRKIVPATQTQGQDLERLAALCDHVPLALRIAGNRLSSRHSWSADDLATRLAAEDRRIDGLRAGDLEIRSTIGLSYDRLSPRARQAFRRLAVLRGTTFGESVAARLVPADLATAEDLLEELSELGLVQAGARGRYHLHDLLRLYARERLFEEEQPDERGRVDTDLRRWLLHVTIDAGRWFEPDYESGPAQPDPLVDLTTAQLGDTWIRTEDEHWFVALQEAARAGDHQLVVDVAESLHWFSDHWMHWGHWHEVFGLAAAAARALGDDEVLATQLGYLSWAETVTRSNPGAGLEFALEAAEAARRARSVGQEAWAGFYACWGAWRLGRLDEALVHGERSVELMIAAGDAAGLVQARRNVGNVHNLAGRPRDALAQEQAVVAWASDPANGIAAQVARFSIAASYCQQAALRLTLEEWEDALEAAAAAIGTMGEHDSSIRPVALAHRADALFRLGRADEARAELRTAIEIFERSGNTDRATSTRQKLATLSDDSA